MREATNMFRLKLLLENVSLRWAEWHSPILEGELPKRLRKLWSRSSGDSTSD